MFDLKTRILIVDDMFAMRKTVIKFCKKIGFSDFVEAENGQDAFAALTDEKSPFGLIISDWNMPKSTGLDLLKKVRASETFRAIPFLMLTAETEQAQVAEAIRAGVSNYIIKPFEFELLVEKLEAMHSKSKA